MAVRLPEGRVLDRDCLGQQPTWLLPAELKHLVVIISRQVFSQCHQVQRLLVSSPPTSRWWGEAHNDRNSAFHLSVCVFSLSFYQFPLHSYSTCSIVARGQKPGRTSPPPFWSYNSSCASFVPWVGLHFSAQSQNEKHSERKADREPILTVTCLMWKNYWLCHEYHVF